jgi:hypothetical protein
MGAKPVGMATGLMQRTVFKFLALYALAKWPAGVKTRPGVEQGIGGTARGEFENGRRSLVTVLRRFAAANRDFVRTPHPIFGDLNEREWLRWAYLHVDHHLRQFGA